MHFDTFKHLNHNSLRATRDTGSSALAVRVPIHPRLTWNDSGREQHFFCPIRVKKKSLLLRKKFQDFEIDTNGFQTKAAKTPEIH